LPQESWPESRKQRFRELWPDDTKSMADIGRELGVSRSAVSGMRKRMKLTPRAASQAEGRSYRADMRKRLKLKEQLKEQVDRDIKAKIRKDEVLSDNPIYVLKPFFLAPAMPVTLTVSPLPGSNSCLYPTGDSPRIRFECTDDAIGGSSYCAMHHRVCYIAYKRSSGFPMGHGL
jgi:hypothetical protein